jgi:ABC-type sugar transport system ATPase subunit
MVRTARRWLEAVDAQVDPDALVGSLSPADRQLVEIARSVGSGARVLFFDEPSAALGPAETERLFRLIRRLVDGGAGVVYVSHRLEEVFAVCDRIVVLRDGSVVEEALVDESDEESLVRAMAGRKLEHVMRETRRFQARDVPVLRVRDLRLGSRLRGVDLVVREGEIHGLAGIVGSGRTRLLAALAGLERPDGGTIELGGGRYAPRSPGSAIEAGVCLVPEDRVGSALFAELSQAVNVVVSRHAAAAAALGLITRAREGVTADPLLQRLDVRPRASTMRAGALSGGNQQKLIVARALFARPRLLLLDEPTRGVDVGAKADIHRLLTELAAEGIAVVLASSDMRELVSLSDRITVMARGRTTGTFEPPFDSQALIAAATADARTPGGIAA